MRPRPRSRYEDENGSINLALVGKVQEYPEVEAWRKEYADECDRLAELEAEKTGNKNYGRWYLTETSLETIIVRPRVGEDGAVTVSTYDIDLDRLNEGWVEHMREKNWIGEKGLQDLGRALSELSKEELKAEKIIG